MLFNNNFAIILHLSKLRLKLQILTAKSKFDLMLNNNIFNFLSKIFGRFILLNLFWLSIFCIQFGVAKESVLKINPQVKENLITSSFDVASLDDSKKENKIILNFDDTDIKTVLIYLAEITGKTVLPDKSVSGKVSIINPKPVTPEEAKQIIFSVLEMNKFTVVNQKNYIKIIKSAEAIRNPIKTVVINRKN